MERTLQQAGNLNPRGFFEDARLVELNRALLARIAPHPWLPPRDDLDADAYRDLTAQISEHIAERLDRSAPWGFKDPRTSWLIPIYARIFNHLRVTPNYVLCVRDPSSAIRSLIESTAMSPKMAELYWFTRNLAVLRDTGANCFVCHYEKMQEDPAAVAAAMSRFVFGQSPPATPSAEEARSAISPSLDRASLKPVPVTGECTRRLYALLRSMDGVAFDRERVRGEIVALDETQSSYQPWLNVAAARVKQLSRAAGEEGGQRVPASVLEAVATALDAGQTDRGSIEAALRAAGAKPLDALPDAMRRLIDHMETLGDDIATTRARLAELSACEGDAQRALVFERAKAAAAVRSAAAGRADLQKLRKELADLEAENREQQTEAVKALRTRVRELETSKRVRMGSAIADALTKPGLKTLTMPARVVRIALSRDSRARDGGDP